MKMIVGLGNPGREYAGTRHNVGWMLVETLAARHRVAIGRSRRRGLRVAARYGEFRYGTETVRVVKPWLLMNRSGEALRALGDAVSAEELLIVCDDVNLPLGRLRLRAQGSAGGHHGLESCLQALGTHEVARLRLGVGGGTPGADLTRLVLSRFRPEEQSRVTDMIERAAEACDAWGECGVETAMDRYNTVTET